MTPILAVLLATQLSLPQATPAHYSLLDNQLEGIGSGSDSAPPPYAVGTIVAQSLVGTGSMVLAAIAGGLVGALLMSDWDTGVGTEGYGALGGGIIGALVAMPLGFGAGVWAAGAFRGHQGSFWATLGTTVVGTLLSVVALGAGSAVSFGISLAATAVVSIWVYHLSDAHSRGMAAVSAPAARPDTRQVVQAQRGVSLLQMAF